MMTVWLLLGLLMTQVFSAPQPLVSISSGENEVVKKVGKPPTSPPFFGNIANGADGYKLNYDLGDGAERQEEGGYGNEIGAVKGMTSSLSEDDKGHTPTGTDALDERMIDPAALASLVG